LLASGQVELSGKAWRSEKTLALGKEHGLREDHAGLRNQREPSATMNLPQNHRCRPKV
jgi:hypothetical protein